MSTEEKKRDFAALALSTCSGLAGRHRARSVANLGGRGGACTVEKELNSIYTVYEIPISGVKHVYRDLIS